MALEGFYGSVDEGLSRVGDEKRNMHEKSCKHTDKLQLNT